MSLAIATTPQTQAPPRLHRRARRDTVRLVSSVSGEPTRTRPMPADTPPNSANDLIISIAASKDRGAFAALFELYAPKLKAYMMRRGAGSAQADDLIQEVMLTVWRKAKQFDPAKASASTWLYTIARNRRIDSLRRDKRLEFDADDPELITDPEDSPHEQVHGTQIGDRVRRAMTDLPEDQKRVVSLSFFEEKSHAEIADALGLPLGTVKSRIRLAMDKLRQGLGDLK